MENSTQNTEVLSQEQQALTLLKEMLKSIDAKDIREDLNKIFYGYISSDLSDDQRERNFKCGTYLSLVEFFTKIANLDKVNYWNK